MSLETTDVACSGHVIISGLRCRIVPLPCAASIYNTPVLCGHPVVTLMIIVVQLYTTNCLPASSSIVDLQVDCVHKGVHKDLSVTEHVNSSVYMLLCFAASA